jgi:hypothetical protein
MANSSIDSYNTGLEASESGGSNTVENDEGYVGLFQYGPKRIADYNAANGTSWTTQSIKGNTPVQREIHNWGVSDVDSYITKRGLDKYIGTTINGVEITQNGLRGAAHLGGNYGMSKFLTTGGEYNPADSNGTTLAHYASKFGKRDAPWGPNPNQQGSGMALEDATNTAEAGEPVPEMSQDAVPAMMSDLMAQALKSSGKRRSVVQSPAMRPPLSTAPISFFKPKKGETK